MPTASTSWAMMPPCWWGSPSAGWDQTWRHSTSECVYGCVFMCVRARKATEWQPAAQHWCQRLSQQSHKHTPTHSKTQHTHPGSSRPPCRCRRMMCWAARSSCAPRSRTGGRRSPCLKQLASYSCKTAGLIFVPKAAGLAPGCSCLDARADSDIHIVADCWSPVP